MRQQPGALPLYLTWCWSLDDVIKSEWGVSTHELLFPGCDGVRAWDFLKSSSSSSSSSSSNRKSPTQKSKVTKNDVTGASGLRGWIRLVEALSISTLGASSSLLGGQNIQKQLKNVNNWPTSGFGDIFLYGFPIYPSLLSAEAGLYIGARGFHSRVIFSWVRWRTGSDFFQIFVVVVVVVVFQPDSIE